MIKKHIYCAIGLMSGTSMDGIDAAMIYTDGETVDRLGPSLTVSYSPEIRAQIKECLAIAAKTHDRSNPPEEIRLLERQLTDMHYKAVEELLSLTHLEHNQIDVIGFHGHTVTHRPDKGWSWQIGDGGRLAGRSDIKVVNDFRSNDLAHGGEGAPLVPIYHRALLKRERRHNTVAIINLGGVGNVTWIDFSDDEENPAILAFDTGPANAILDDWAEVHTGIPCDKDGALAARGIAHTEVISQLMNSPYFDEVPPKSLDRDDFNVQSARGLSAEDGAATLTDFVVESVVAAQSHFPKPVEAWYVCGGGCHNKTLMRRLRAHTSVMIDPVEVLGWRGDALEAEAFAFLAVRRLLNLPASLPSITGVDEPCIGGVISEPY